MTRFYIATIFGASALIAGSLPASAQPKLHSPPKATSNMMGKLPTCVSGTSMSVNFQKLPVMREPVVGGGGGGSGDGSDGGIASSQEIAEDALQDQIDNGQPSSPNNAPNSSNSKTSSSNSSGSHINGVVSQNCQPSQY
jgi:hypothetical protein